jgi:hypothetical protein
MANEGMPPELESLERELMDRKVPGPSEDLRQRVVSAARAARGKRASSRRLRHVANWRFAAAAAAAVVLWLNLSMSAVNNTTLFARDRGDVRELKDSVRRLCSLLPELSEDEAVRRALLMKARAGWVPVPPVPGPTALGANKEVDLWDTE